MPVDAIVEALGMVLEPTRLLWMTVGVLVGLVIGIIPGMGGTVGLSITLPFVFGMEPLSAIGMMIGLSAVTTTSDSLTTVLLGIPGTSSSQAIILDGYPMAQQGRASEALGAGYSSAAIGGVLGAVLLFGVLLIARPIILALASPELFMLVLIGLSMVALLSAGHWVMGFISAFLGLLFGLVGLADQVPQQRYMFGELYFVRGISISLVALGLFAFAEMFTLLPTDRSVSDRPPLTRGLRVGIKQSFKHIRLVIQGAMTGIGVGMIPGVGGSVIDWITYGISKQTVKDNENFGNGDIRGVVGVEAAANASEGGVLVPTLALGIPGNSTTALLLGAFVVLGIPVGPSLLGADISITLSIVWTLAIASVLGSLIMLGAGRYLANIAYMSSRKLFTFMLPLFIMAALQVTASWWDVGVLLGFGVLGVVMKIIRMPRPPLLIGFVLAESADRYLHVSMSAYGWAWLTRPIVIALGLVIVAILVYAIRSDRKDRSSAQRIAQGSGVDV